MDVIQAAEREQAQAERVEILGEAYSSSGGRKNCTMATIRQPSSVSLQSVAEPNAPM